MTNKRITELTALDGDDVADNDVLAIVDVSDTTMAASGTTKKITVAELVTDSALKGAFWPNSTTALTGANLANGDKLAVVDVGSPDVPKYITADELAQGSQFTSRYVSTADEIRIDLSNQPVWNQSTGAFSSPVTIGDGSGTAPAFLKTTPTAQAISLRVATPIIPASWTTADIKLHYSIQSASSDNAVFRAIYTSYVGDGTNSAGSVGPDVTIDLTGKTAYFYNVVTLVSGFTTSTHEGSGKYFQIQVVRRADQAGDTASVTVYGLQLVIAKAS